MDAVKKACSMRSLLIKATGKDILVLKLGGIYFAKTSIVRQRQVY